jgi:hypothetical protein
MPIFWLKFADFYLENASKYQTLVVNLHFNLAFTP